jgi:uncharacterized membrane protein YfhO
MRIDADLPRPGLLVISQRAFPGWQAFVDGRPADVLPANIVFNAVALPAGRHTLEWTFAPRSVLRAGVSRSLRCFCGCLVVLGNSHGDKAGLLI